MTFEGTVYCGIALAERDGTRAETRFRLSPKRTSPFKSVGASVQSTAGSRGVRISFNNAGYTTFGGGVRILATHSIRQFPLHFPSRASPCATRFRTSFKNVERPAETRQDSQHTGTSGIKTHGTNTHRDQLKHVQITHSLVSRANLTLCSEMQSGSFYERMFV